MSDTDYIPLASGPHDLDVAPTFHKPPRSSKLRKVVAIGAPISIILIFLGLSINHTQLKTLWDTSETDLSLDVDETPADANPLRGYWVPNEKNRMDSKAWGPFSGTCLPPGGDNGTRAENVDGWEWLLDGGGHLRQWDIEEFVARGLQSRMGWVIVGDSLSVEVFQAFDVMMLLPNLTAWPGPVEVDYSEDYQRANISLNHDHELYTRLSARLDLAQVPPKRLAEPFLRFYRSDMLLDSEDHVQSVVKASGLEGGIAIGEAYTDWAGDLQRYGTNQTDSWEGELPSLVMINSGSHWDGERKANGTDERLVQAYTLAVEDIAQKLLKVENTPLHVDFRSTLAGHQDCTIYTNPADLTDPIALDPTGNHTDTFGWHLFPEYNRVAQETFNGQRNGAGNVQLTYFDAWELSLTRPDAHLGSMAGGAKDCLRWCAASVPQVLAKLWWHTVSNEE